LLRIVIDLSALREAGILYKDLIISLSGGVELNEETVASVLDKVLGNG
jgi:hypothetical protein